MQRALLFIFLLFVFFSILPSYSVAQEANNKFGIHLAQPGIEDLIEAADLVNAQGGDWGYVTLVMQDNDRDHGKWQDIFNHLRRLHLIPVIRIATHPEGANWRRPNSDEAGEWAGFLDSLNWPVKKRYIILFNETNHGQEWGGEVDAVNYADVAKAFAQKLKEKNSDFIVMLAGFDASAPNGLPAYQDEASYLQTVISTITPEVFDSLFSALSSHSYPNPGFAGSPNGSGKGTVRTYEWELEYLRSLGVKKELPVFITETGWSAESVSRDSIASNLKQTFENVWLPDKRVIAVTPFILNYQSMPFLNFSWRLFESKEYYPQFYTVQSMSKTKGEPEQREKGSISLSLPHELVAQSTYHFTLKLKNEGQGYWDASGGYKIGLEDVPAESFLISNIYDIQPYDDGEVDFYLKTANTPGKFEARISLLKNDKKIIDDVYWQFEVLPLPDLRFNVLLYPKADSNGSGFELQLFNAKEELVYKRKGIEVKDRKGVVRKIQNIALGEVYRAVLLKPNYLPRQEFVIFKKEGNFVQFKEMLPFDFDYDGAFTIGDLGYLFLHPDSLKLLLP